MRKVLLLFLVVVLTSFTHAHANAENFNQLYPEELQQFIPKTLINLPYCKIPRVPLDEIKKMLYLHADTLNKAVINTVLTTIKCSREHNVQFNNILTIIDYSLSSDKKRLWVFDLQEKKLLFHTYVSHGIKSGTLTTTYFSNKVDSQASSLGIFATGNTYYGRHGLSLKLLGLDKNFNDRAYQRAIVMHSAWYVNKAFVKKYGRVGRSWGCPAVPSNLAKPIMNLIKEQSLFVVYYPSSQWFSTSKFLNCTNISLASGSKNLENVSTTAEDEHREEVFFADKNNNKKREESEPILVMSTENYQRIFKTQVPLKRMLRRQINDTEYIALDNEELKSLDSNHDNVINNSDIYGLSNVEFVIPLVINIKGYYATQFKFVNLGKIQELKLNSTSYTNVQQDYTYLINVSDKYFINLRSTNYFIRWLGL